MNARRFARPSLRLALVAALSSAAPVAGSAAVTTGTPVRGTPVRSAATATSRPGAARSTFASDAPVSLPPLTVDSLASDKLPRRGGSGGFIVASDVNQLIRLRREVEYGTSQFRRYIGMYPDPIRIAAVGDLDPSRVNVALLKSGGVDYVVTDWPEPRKPGVPPANTWISDRVARWSLDAWEHAHATGQPAAGHARITPDWFAAAIEELAMPVAEQNQRIAWMRAHLAQHVPLARFLDMTRPAAEAAAAGEDTHPGPSPPVRVRAMNGAVRAPGRAASPRASVGPGDELFDAQSLAFAKFLVFREDERFLGLWYEIILTGQPQSAAFNIAKTMLSSPEVMEKEWLAWMKDPDASPPPRPSD